MFLPVIIVVIDAAIKSWLWITPTGVATGLSIPDAVGESITIFPVKSNPDYLLITENTLPIIDLTINLNAGSSHDGSLPGLTNLSFESISKLKYILDK